MTYPFQAASGLILLEAEISGPRLMVNRLTTLGHHAIGLRVLAHDLPSQATVDGLLGLDFLRRQSLKIDFRTGRIDLS